MHTPILYDLHHNTDLTSAILLISDDEMATTNNIIQGIKLPDYKMLTSTDPIIGLEIFNKEKPKVVIIDISTPTTTTVAEILAKIKEQSPHTQIIIISAADEMNNAIIALRLGAWDYFLKPITNIDPLQHSIAKAIEQYDLILDKHKYVEHLTEDLNFFDDDQKAGRNIQKKLLPKSRLLQHGNYTFDYIFNPCSYLSSDFLEYFSLTDDKVAVYLIDVSGKGAAGSFTAALATNIIKQAFKRFQSQTEDPTILIPDRLLTELSAILYAQKLGHHLSITYGIMDTSNQNFTYAIGGHTINVLFDENGKASLLPGSGLPIGLLAQASYSSANVILKENQSIFLFSDGALPLLGNHLDEQRQTLLNIIQDQKGNLDAILTKINTHAKQLDDITILHINHNKAPQ